LQPSQKCRVSGVGSGNILGGIGNLSPMKMTEGPALEAGARQNGGPATKPTGAGLSRLRGDAEDFPERFQAAR
jgi:hypothetical protein